MNFDLSTEEGRKSAVEAFDKYGWILCWPAWLLRQMTKGGTDAVEAQKQTVVEIIKAGKEHNVDKMTITLERTTGMDFGSEIEGVPIKMKIGDSGKVTIEAQYFHAT